MGIQNTCILTFRSWGPWASQVIFSVSTAVAVHQAWSLWPAASSHVGSLPYVNEEGQQWDVVTASVKSAFLPRFWWEHKDVSLYNIIEKHFGTLRGQHNVNVKLPHQPSVDKIMLRNWNFYSVSSIPLTNRGISSIPHRLYTELFQSEALVLSAGKWWFELDDLSSQFPKSEILWFHVSGVKQELISVLCLGNFIFQHNKHLTLF